MNSTNLEKIKELEDTNSNDNGNSNNENDTNNCTDSNTPSRISLFKNAKLTNKLIFGRSKISFNIEHETPIADTELSPNNLHKACSSDEIADSENHNINSKNSNEINKKDFIEKETVDDKSQNIKAPISNNNIEEINNSDCFNRDNTNSKTNSNIRKSTLKTRKILENKLEKNNQILNDSEGNANKHIALAPVGSIISPIENTIFEKLNHSNSNIDDNKNRNYDLVKQSENSFNANNNINKSNSSRAESSFSIQNTNNISIKKNNKEPQKDLKIGNSSSSINDNKDKTYCDNISHNFHLSADIEKENKNPNIDSKKKPHNKNSNDKITPISASPLNQQTDSFNKSAKASNLSKDNTIELSCHPDKSSDSQRIGEEPNTSDFNRKNKKQEKLTKRIIEDVKEKTQEKSQVVLEDIEYLREIKELKKIFKKNLLKIKFEKFPNTEGCNIKHLNLIFPEKEIFNSIINKNIPEEEWYDFIYEEILAYNCLQNPNRKDENEVRINFNNKKRHILKEDKQIKFCCDETIDTKAK